MLVSAKEMLNKAREGKYAVGQFNINNLEWTKQILLTAQEMNSPVILGDKIFISGRPEGIESPSKIGNCSETSRGRFGRILDRKIFIREFPP